MSGKEKEGPVELEVVGEKSALLAEDEKSPQSEENFRNIHDYQPPTQKSILKRINCGAVCSKKSWLGLFPILTWLPHYDIRECLVRDLIAGVTVSVLQIPHGLAFAPLGGQQPVVGLYMAVFPIIMYLVLGTSRHISLGMMAIFIMMVGKVVETHSISDAAVLSGTVEGYTKLEVGITATFTIGLWQCILGFMRLGTLCVLLSNSLVSGLTTGAAIHIAFIQLKHIFGIQYTMTTGPLKLIYATIEFFKHVSQTNYIALCTSLAFMLFLYVFNEYGKQKIAKKCSFPIPMEFILVFVGIGLSELIDLRGSYNIKVVGTVPSGLPDPVIPIFTLMPAIAMDCLIIALVGISISISLAKIFAKKGGYQIEDNQELIAYGASNMFGAFFQSLPVSASLSRTMVQFAVGGKTQMAHAVSLLAVLFILLVLGPVFEKIPLCVLAAIVAVSVKGLVMQVRDFPGIWRASKLDGAVWMITFLSVVFIDIDYGIGIGLVTSIFVLIHNSVESQVVTLGQIQNLNRFIDKGSYKIAETDSKVFILKIIGAINFYNASIITDKMNKAIADFWERSRTEENSWTCIIIDLSAVPYVDVSGINELVAFNHFLQANHGEMIITDCSSSVYETFETCDFFKQLPKSHVMINVYAALEYLRDKKLINS